MEQLPTYRPAGFWIRFVANLLDMILTQLALFLAFLPFGGILDQADRQFALGKLVAIGVVMLVIEVAVLVWPTYRYGGTPGKRLLGLRVVRVDYRTDLSMPLAFAREVIGKTISGLTLMVGYLMAAFGEKRALHDLICATRVVYDVRR